MPIRFALAHALLLPALALAGFRPTETAQVPVGSPAELVVSPPRRSPWSARGRPAQLVVTGKYADGTVRDLTTVATAKVEPAGVVEVQDGLFLRPKKNGTATVRRHRRRQGRRACRSR